VKRTLRVAAAGIVTFGVAIAASSGATAASGGARDDRYVVRADRTTRVPAARGVLANDRPAYAQIVAHTDPAQGSLRLGRYGQFRYTPNAGASGTDSFTYTTSSAVRLYTEHIKPLATIGGVPIGGSAYGSAIAAKPGSDTIFYGLTDRGPNVDGPNGTKVEAIPSFTPAIGEFALVAGKAVLLRTIKLRAADGTPMNGQVSTLASTGETITDLAGNVLAASPYGIDSEGLVAMKDGSFWVSDEYGPFVIHFDRNGRELQRLSPQAGSLPAELAHRTVNRGMEGLTTTPDGKTLVGIMQSALDQADSSKPKNNPLTRIVTINLKTKVVHEYAYLLDDPATNGTANSEITALSNTTFLVDERDGNFEPNAYKRLYTVDISAATDLGPASKVSGASYDSSAAALGLTVGGKSLEALTKGKTAAQAGTVLTGAGITPVTKSLKLDLGAYLTGLNAKGFFYGHDKVEGIAVVNHGRTLVVANDNDFGISGVNETAAPFTLVEKTLPDGTQDAGEILTIDLTRVDEPTSTATARLTLR
jgi:hypothetical protein